MKIAIVTLATENYLIGMRNLYLSIQNLDHDLNEIEFICISDNQDKFEYVGNKKIKYEHLLDLSKFSGIKLNDRFSTTINKFQIFEILQKGGFDRLIFFDSDLLCVSKITSLFEIEFSDKAFLAVKDYACGRYYGEVINKIGLNANLVFNTGLMVLNRKILDDLDFSKITRFLESDMESYDNGDQGLFNFIFQKLNISVTFLPVEYNDALDFNYPVSFTFPKLIHFTGFKPWNSNGKTRFYDKNYYRFYKFVVKFHENHSNEIGISIFFHKQILNCFLLFCIFERNLWKFLYRAFK